MKAVLCCSRDSRPGKPLGGQRLAGLWPLSVGSTSQRAATAGSPGLGSPVLMNVCLATRAGIQQTAVGNGFGEMGVPGNSASQLAAGCLVALEGERRGGCPLGTSVLTVHAHSQSVAHRLQD